MLSKSGKPQDDYYTYEQPDIGIDLDNLYYDYGDEQRRRSSDDFLGDDYGIESDTTGDASSQ